MATRQVHPVAPPSRPASPGAAEGASSPDVLADVVLRERTIGLYIHVPFCARRCHYCSFNTAPLHQGVERYLHALAREMDLVADLRWARDVRLASIFLGGGTPSVLEAHQLAALLDGVRAHFGVEPDAEITAECNPESVSRAKLEAYRRAGVSRLSLGVQSLEDDVLATLGRLHTADGARRAFVDAREAGFENVSVDLMYGLPGLDVARFRATVERVLAWRPEHLSAYGLALDPGSVWTSRGVPGLPPEETTVAQYWAVATAAAAAGFEHYEISNYARPGCRSRHNERYWLHGEYAALGPGAAGFLGDLRYANARATVRYCRLLEDGGRPVGTWERLSPPQRRAERLILGLRRADGVSRSVLVERLAGDDRLASVVAGWRDRDLLVDAGDRVRLTEAGFLLSDALFAELL